jgi:hypothetical protein
MPKTVPTAETVAVAVALLLHTPPEVTSANDNVVPVHTVGAEGVMPPGPGITVTILIT